MRIQSEQILKIDHERYGVFYARAITDFDTSDDWYRLKVDQTELRTLTMIWKSGEEIRIRKGSAKIVVLSK